MADNDFEIESVGLVYAQALANLAGKQGVLQEVTADVRGLRQVLETNPDFSRFTAAATISDEEKIAALVKIFEGRVNRLVLETLKAMARRDRLVFLPGLIAAFEDVLAKLAKRVEVELVSAQPLAPEATERVRRRIGEVLQIEADMKASVDPKLLGGLRLRIGDTLIDGSVETQLQHMRRQLEDSGANALQKSFAQIVEE